MNDYSHVMEKLNSAEGYNRHNGIEVIRIEDGYCQVRCMLGRSSMNHQNMAHGSLVFGLCDVAAGVAAMTQGRIVLTLSSSINFLRPGTGEYLIAEGKRVRAGRTTGVFEARVYDSDDRLVAKGDVSVYYTGDIPDLPENGSGTAE